jgi:hypothetical protein
MSKILINRQHCIATRYWLDDRAIRFQLLAKARAVSLLYNAYTGPTAHTASCQMCTGSSFDFDNVGGIEAVLFTFFTFLVTAGKWFASHSSCITSGKNPLCNG